MFYSFECDNNRGILKRLICYMIFCLCLELRHANVNNVHGRSGSVPGRVRITSTTLPSKHGTHHADKRAGKNLPIPLACDY